MMTTKDHERRMMMLFLFIHSRRLLELPPPGYAGATEGSADPKDFLMCQLPLVAKRESEGKGILQRQRRRRRRLLRRKRKPNKYGRRTLRRTKKEATIKLF